MSGNELPKVIDKSPADIDAAIAAIKSSNLSNNTKELAVSCIRLAIWLPKALLEHRIKLSNLRKLIFGFGGKNKKQSKQEHNAEESNEQKNKIAASISADVFSITLGSSLPLILSFP